MRGIPLPERHDERMVVGGTLQPNLTSTLSTVSGRGQERQAPSRPRVEDLLVDQDVVGSMGRA